MALPRVFSVPTQRRSRVDPEYLANILAMPEVARQEEKVAKYQALGKIPSVFAEGAKMRREAALSATQAAEAGAKAQREAEMFPAELALKRAQESETKAQAETHKARAMALSSPKPYRPKIAAYNFNGKLNEITYNSDGVEVSRRELGLNPESASAVQKAISDYGTADGILSRMKELSIKVLEARRPEDLPEQWVSIQLNRFSKSNTDAVAFLSVMNTFAPALSKASGQVGSLSDKDIAIIMEAMPKAHDTLASALKKLDTVEIIYDARKKAAIAAYTQDLTKLTKKASAGRSPALPQKKEDGAFAKRLTELRSKGMTEGQAYQKMNEEGF